MKKLIIVVSFTLGFVLNFCSHSYAQLQHITLGRLAEERNARKLNIAKQLGDSFHILTASSDSFLCFEGTRHGEWHNSFGIDYPDNYNIAELVANRNQVYIYERNRDSLYFLTDFGIESRYCPGRPVIDATGAIHLIWTAMGSSRYGVSFDTLATFAFMDTLPQASYRLLTSPDDSLVCAFFKPTWDSLYKFLGQAGQPIDFSSPTNTFAGSMPSGYDVAMDSHGRFYSVGIDFAHNHDECPIGHNYCHYAWIENYGIRFIDIAIDDALDTPAFQFSFGENGDVLLIKDGTAPFGFTLKGLFISTDYGNTWHKSSYWPPYEFSYYGSAPRTFSDTVDFFYYVGYSPYYSPYDVFYYPIPRDSIFANLLPATDEEPLSAVINISNFPNPFNGETMISFSAPVGSNTTIEVFDIGGRLIRTLTNELVIPGTNYIKWDGRRFDGDPVSSGIYLARIKAGSELITRKMLLLK
jgi:hypothetical protein